MRYKVLLFITSLFIMVSCESGDEKMTFKPIDKFSINFNIENGMLVFASPTEYENLLDTLAYLGYDYFINWDKNTEFRSIRSSLEEANLLTELPIKDELLAVVLDDQYRIKIGQYTFKLDPDSEQIVVIDDLKSASTLFFSFDDEIITHLFESENSLKSTNSCDYPSKCTPTTSWTCWGEEIVCKAHYYKAGIYNSIFVEMKLTNCIFSGVQMTLATNDYAYCVYNKCRDTRSLSFGETKTGCRIYRNLYRKAKRVNECDLEVNYSAVSADNACNEARYLEVKF